MAERQVSMADFKKWGAEGGRKRRDRLSPERRKEIASLAGRAPKRLKAKKWAP